MFEDRRQAGAQLCERLKRYQKRADTLVIGIPRGGVVVASVIASALHLPLSVISVKKLSAPHNPELAIGAICASAVRYIDWELALRVGVEQDYLDKQIQEKLTLAKEREQLYGIKNAVKDRKKYTDFILVDDGIATGATVLAAVKDLKEQAGKVKKHSNVILAVPVIAKEVFDKLRKAFNVIIALLIEDQFAAVGQFYREFTQVSDGEVINILKEHKQKSII